MRTSDVLSISLPRKIARAVNQKSRQSGLSRSELLRMAVLRYLNEEEREAALTRDIQARARKMGIRTEDDIEALVDSIRR